MLDEVFMRIQKEWMWKTHPSHMSYAFITNIIILNANDQNRPYARTLEFSRGNNSFETIHLNISSFNIVFDMLPITVVLHHRSEKKRLKLFYGFHSLFLERRWAEYEEHLLYDVDDDCVFQVFPRWRISYRNFFSTLQPTVVIFWASYAFFFFFLCGGDINSKINILENRFLCRKRNSSVRKTRWWDFVFSGQMSSSK